jgi:hypothetical protein
VDGSNEFSGNSATYGSNVASYAKELKASFISNNDPNIVTQNSRMMRRRRLDGEEEWEVISGTKATLRAEMYDQDGNLYNIDNSTIATFESTDSTANITLSNNVKYSD